MSFILSDGWKISAIIKSSLKKNTRMYDVHCPPVSHGGKNKKAHDLISVKIGTLTGTKKSAGVLEGNCSIL